MTNPSISLSVSNSGTWTTVCKQCKQNIYGICYSNLLGMEALVGMLGIYLLQEQTGQGSTITTGWAPEPLLEEP